MKILILQDDFPPQSFGGAGFSTFSLASGLHKAGHQVFVITACQKISEETNLDYQGLKVFRIFANFHQRWQAYLGIYNPQVVGKIKKIIKEINPDIVHAHNLDSYLSYYSLKIAKDLQKPVFWTARDVMSFSYGKLATEKYLNNFNCRVNWIDHLKQAKKRYNPLRNFLIRKYLSYVDQKFAVSKALKKALHQNGIKNVKVIHTGIDVNDWKINRDIIKQFKIKYNLKNKKIIFFAGRISYLKGSEQIEKAIEIIEKDIPNVFLLIAGNNGVGWLNGDELKAAYLACDVVVVPSICLDAFPRNNLEAMACKKPVVATCFGGSFEVVQDGKTGYIVNPLDINLLAEKIIDLLKNPKKAKSFGKAGFQRIQKEFSLAEHINKTLKYYEQSLESKN